MAIYGEVQVKAVANPAVRFGYFLTWPAASQSAAVYFVFADRVFHAQTSATRLALALADSDRHEIAVVAAGSDEDPDDVLATVPAEPADCVELVWVASVGAATYNVYWDAGAGEAPTTLLATVTDTIYTTAKLATGTYRFKVNAVDAPGNPHASALEAEIAVKTYPEAPCNFAVDSFDEAESQASLSWQAD